MTATVYNICIKISVHISWQNTTLSFNNTANLTLSYNMYFVSLQTHYIMYIILLHIKVTFEQCNGTYYVLLYGRVVNIIM